MSCMMFTKGSILEEKSWRWEGFDKIWSQRDDRIGFDYKTFCIGNREHRLIHV